MRREIINVTNLFHHLKRYHLSDHITVYHQFQFSLHILLCHNNHKTDCKLRLEVLGQPGKSVKQSKRVIFQKMDHVLLLSKTLNTLYNPLARIDLPIGVPWQVSSCDCAWPHECEVSRG